MVSMSAPGSCVDTMVTVGACACVHQSQRGGHLDNSGPLSSERGCARFRVTTALIKLGQSRIVPDGRLTARAIQSCFQRAGRTGTPAYVP